MKTPDLLEESQEKLTNDVEWAWDVARLFPAQGQWSEKECFAILVCWRGLKWT